MRRAVVFRVALGNLYSLYNIPQKPGATGLHRDLLMLQGAVNPLQILNPKDFQTWLSGQ